MSRRKKRFWADEEKRLGNETRYHLIWTAMEYRSKDGAAGPLSSEAATLLEFGTIDDNPASQAIVCDFDASVMPPDILLPNTNKLLGQVLLSDDRANDPRFGALDQIRSIGLHHKNGTAIGCYRIVQAFDLLGLLSEAVNMADSRFDTVKSVTMFQPEDATVLECDITFTDFEIVKHEITARSTLRPIVPKILHTKTIGTPAIVRFDRYFFARADIAAQIELGDLLGLEICGRRFILIEE